MDALIPETLAAADRLEEMGVSPEVVCVTSAGRLYEAMQSRRRRSAGAQESWILDEVFPVSRAAPMVTVLDGHPHTLSFLATINGVEHIPLGVSEFGQSGDVEDVYCHHGIDSDSIIGAALDASYH